jgi:hypothetical protein
MTHENMLSKSGVRRSHLDISQSRDKTQSVSLKGDVLLLVSSWEGRSTEISLARHSNYRLAAIVKFEERGISGNRELHDEKLDIFAASVADKMHEFEPMSSSNYFGWRDSFVDYLVEGRNACNRPIDLVVDMSCLPKYYLLMILGFSIKSGLVRSLTFFYAEGRYAPATSNITLSESHAFTEGDWQSFPVPYLEGELNPDRKVRIIASIGFETFQARKVIRAYEAERHILVTPFPGFAPEYETHSESEAIALATHLDLGSKDVVRAPAGGAVETLEIALGLLDSTSRYNDVGLCLGTKPQALGFGLAAGLRPHFTLVCRMPQQYVESGTPALGTSWKYSIIDLSALGSTS